MPFQYMLYNKEYIDFITYFILTCKNLVFEFCCYGKNCEEYERQTVFDIYLIYTERHKVHICITFIHYCNRCQSAPFLVGLLLWLLLRETGIL